jgi:hypothetical protein
MDEVATIHSGRAALAYDVFGDNCATFRELGRKNANLCWVSGAENAKRIVQAAHDFAGMREGDLSFVQVGVGRVVVSDIEAPDIFANLV